MKKAFISALAVATIAMGSVFAADAKISASSDAMMMPVPENSTKTYKFDTKALTTLLSGSESSLQEITCPRDSILQTLGLLGTLGSNRKWTSLTYEDTSVNMFVSYDLI